MKHEATLYSRLPITETLTGEVDEAHETLTANHLLAALAFTIGGDVEHKELPTQRVALAILIDGASYERGMCVTPDIVMALLDQFAELVRDTFGPHMMAEAILTKMLLRYGSDVSATVETPPTEH